MKDKIVDPGDCFDSVAFDNGFFWQTLWNHPRNASLQAQRKDPFTLVPGDVIHVPDLRPRDEACATDQVHTFKLKGVPGKLKLRLYDEYGNPRTNVPYELNVDGAVSGGQTDGDGRIDRFIPPNARQAKLILNADPPEEYELFLGCLEPIDTTIGLKMRLANLGFYEGPLDAEESDELAEAIQAFQASQELEPVGERNDETRARLLKVYGE